MINTIEILVSIVSIIVDHAGSILACLWGSNILSVAGSSAAVFILLAVTGYGEIPEGVLTLIRKWHGNIKDRFSCIDNLVKVIEQDPTGIRPPPFNELLSNYQQLEELIKPCRTTATSTADYMLRSSLLKSTVGLCLLQIKEWAYGAFSARTLTADQVHLMGFLLPREQGGRHSRTETTDIIAEVKVVNENFICVANVWHSLCLFIRKTKIVFSVFYSRLNMQVNTFLIQNCLNIFFTQGIKVSMDGVAKELAMSKRTLYEIFENKSELIYKCILFLVDEEKERMEHDLSQKGVNVIEKLFPLLNYDIYERMKKHHHFFLDVKRYYPEIFIKIAITHIDSYQVYLGKIVKEGITQSVFRDDIHVDIVKAFFFSLMTTYSHNNKELFQRYSMVEVFKNTVLCYIRGISTPEGIQLIEDILQRNHPRFEEV